MFIACVVNPLRWITTVAESAASSADPEYEEAGMERSKESPPYDSEEGTPEGTGRVVAEKYGG